MKIGTLVKISFIAFYFIAIIGAFLKITHVQGAEPFLITAVILSLIFIAASLYEINTLKRIDRSKKIMWTIGLILFTGIASLIYMFSGRKRIATN